MATTFDSLARTKSTADLMNTLFIEGIAIDPAILQRVVEAIGTNHFRKLMFVSQLRNVGIFEASGALNRGALADPTLTEEAANAFLDDVGKQDADKASRKPTSPQPSDYHRYLGATITEVFDDLSVKGLRLDLTVKQSLIDSIGDNQARKQGLLEGLRHAGVFTDNGKGGWSIDPTKLSDRTVVNKVVKEFNKQLPSTDDQELWAEDIIADRVNYLGKNPALPEPQGHSNKDYAKQLMNRGVQGGGFTKEAIAGLGTAFIADRIVDERPLIKMPNLRPLARRGTLAKLAAASGAFVVGAALLAKPVVSLVLPAFKDWDKNRQQQFVIKVIKEVESSMSQKNVTFSKVDSSGKTRDDTLLLTQFGMQSKGFSFDDMSDKIDNIFNDLVRFTHAACLTDDTLREAMTTKPVQPFPRDLVNQILQYWKLPLITEGDDEDDTRDGFFDFDFDFPDFSTDKFGDVIEGFGRVVKTNLWESTEPDPRDPDAEPIRTPQGAKKLFRQIADANPLPKSETTEWGTTEWGNE